MLSLFLISNVNAIDLSGLEDFGASSRRPTVQQQAAEPSTGFDFSSLPSSTTKPRESSASLRREERDEDIPPVLQGSDLQKFDLGDDSLDEKRAAAARERREAEEAEDNLGMALALEEQMAAEKARKAQLEADAFRSELQEVSGFGDLGTFGEASQPLASLEEILSSVDATIEEAFNNPQVLDVMRRQAEDFKSFLGTLNPKDAEEAFATFAQTVKFFSGVEPFLVRSDSGRDVQREFERLERELASTKATLEALITQRERAFSARATITPRAARAAEGGIQDTVNKFSSATLEDLIGRANSKYQILREFLEFAQTLIDAGIDPRLNVFQLFGQVEVEEVKLRAKINENDQQLEAQEAELADLRERISSLEADDEFISDKMRETMRAVPVLSDVKRLIRPANEGDDEAAEALARIFGENEDLGVTYDEYIDSQLKRLEIAGNLKAFRSAEVGKIRFLEVSRNQLLEPVQDRLDLLTTIKTEIQAWADHDAKLAGALNLKRTRAIAEALGMLKGQPEAVTNGSEVLTALVSSSIDQDKEALEDARILDTKSFTFKIPDGVLDVDGRIATVSDTVREVEKAQNELLKATVVSLDGNTLRIQEGPIRRGQENLRDILKAQSEKRRRAEIERARKEQELQAERKLQAAREQQDIEEARERQANAIFNEIKAALGTPSSFIDNDKNNRMKKEPLAELARLLENYLSLNKRFDDNAINVLRRAGVSEDILNRLAVTTPK